MSRTRALVAGLRARLEAERPMPEPSPLEAVPAPPHRIFPSAANRGAHGAAAASHTTALVGIGHVGTRYATDVVLQFQAELAVAHQAVDAELPADFAARHGLLPLQSRVTTHREFLLRPDLGRRLDAPSLARLRAEARRGVDVQPILADGLSATACMGSGVELLRRFVAACEAQGLSVGTPVCARFARVWLEDEIAETMGARVAAILLGERPGLGTGDGLSAYLVFDPKVGKTDGDRNMMSNIHARGTPPAEAARRLAVLARAMLEQRTSGVGLDLAGLAGELGDAGGRGYRAPEPRVKLVEVAK
ncbi:MAG: ethanolamine ammonia-lyase subunit EutC [Deltaproteobacteria bacterium]|nr:ethanolamine ammonia-lyase subunit EutC [Deltaproteobacteria bacterium]